MAASVAAPDKRVLMVNGDGTFGLNGFDFDTFVRHNMSVVSVIGRLFTFGPALLHELHR
jgi:acetolactate synthase-1/2/3 large subunit